MKVIFIFSTFSFYFILFRYLYYLVFHTVFILIFVNDFATFSLSIIFVFVTHNYTGT